MSETRLDVRTDDGVMDVYLHRPASAGPAPVVIFYPDAGGVRRSQQQMAERLASHGYLGVLVNTLYRAGAFAPFDIATTFSAPPERERLMGIMKLATGDAVMRDTRALLDVLASEPGAGTGPIGTIGYCMGGRLAFIAAGAIPDRVAAAASIHGGHIAVDDPSSPHLQAAKIRAKLYFGVADNDGSCTPESQAKLEAALDAARVRYQLEVYPGALHGFAVPDFPWYDEAAAEQHWARVTALFAETLHAGR